MSNHYVLDGPTPKKNDVWRYTRGDAGCVFYETSGLCIFPPASSQSSVSWHDMALAFEAIKSHCKHWFDVSSTASFFALTVGMLRKQSPWKVSATHIPTGHLTSDLIPEVQTNPEVQTHILHDTSFKMTWIKLVSVSVAKLNFLHPVHAVAPKSYVQMPSNQNQLW